MYPEVSISVFIESNNTVRPFGSWSRAPRDTKVVPLKLPYELKRCASRIKRKPTWIT
jgi:hypothetical protein